MILFPSKKLKGNLDSNRSGIFWDVIQNKERVLAIKISTNLLKVVYKNPHISLIVAIVRSQGMLFRGIGIKIDDEIESPWISFQVFSSNENFNELKKFLENSEKKVYFFDELSRCIFGSNISIQQNDIDSIKSLIEKFDSSQTSDDSSMIEKALDDFLVKLEKHSTKSEDDLIEIPIELKIDKINKIRFLQTGTYILDDTDEGQNFEQSLHSLFYYLFGKNSHRSPHVNEGKKTRELSDIIGFNENGLLIIEAKSMSVFDKKIYFEKSRKSKLIEKHINKAINQLDGAIKNIRSSKKLLTKNGNNLSIPNRESIPILAIVALTELYPFINNKILLDKIISKSKTDGDPYVLFYILDLSELFYITSASRGNSDQFIDFLIQHWKNVFKAKNIFAKGRLPKPNN